MRQYKKKYKYNKLLNQNVIFLNKKINNIK